MRWTPGIPVRIIVLTWATLRSRSSYVIRAPTLVLLNARSEIVWRQDETLNNVAPLDLEQVKILLAKD
jgi:hypothetical protein